MHRAVCVKLTVRFRDQSRIFGAQTEMASCPPSGAYNLEVATRLPENLCTPH